MADIPDTTDVAVIGAGPIGLELGVSLKRAGIDYQILEAGQIGHTISWYAPGTRFFSSPERIAIAGVPLMTHDQGKATREEYLHYLRTIAWQFELAIHCFHRVHSISSHDGGFRLGLRKRGSSAESELRCRFLILAVGDMHRPRLLEIPGEDQENVSHYLQDLHNYFRQRVVIVGARNSAVEAAIRIFRMGGEVTILYRGENFDGSSIKYWLLPEIQSLVKSGMIRFINHAEAYSIEGNCIFFKRTGPERQEKSVDKDGESQMDSLEADQFLLLTGYAQDPSLFQMAGLELDGAEHRPRISEATNESSVSGIYVAGTAIAGSQQRHKVFIENSHVHVERIVADLCRKGIGENKGESTGADEPSRRDQPGTGSGQRLSDDLTREFPES